LMSRTLNFTFCPVDATFASCRIDVTFASMN